MQAVEELNASSAQITALLKARQAERAAARAAAEARPQQQLNSLHQVTLGCKVLVTGLACKW